MHAHPWLIYAVIPTVFRGIWGALVEIPEKASFPATLSYSVWALTIIPPALVALKIIRWHFEHNSRSILLGCIIGFTGAGGQLILFEALRRGPAYLVFPFISLSPMVTVLLLSYRSAQGNGRSGYVWILRSLLVFLAWGVQAYLMMCANQTMRAESIFFYMTVAGVVLIPLAVSITDFSQPINWGLKGPYFAAVIQLLNAIGALTIVYSFRYGKAIIVSPLTNALAPVITIVISLLIYRAVPEPIVTTGMALAVIAISVLTFEDVGEVPENDNVLPEESANEQ